MEYKWLILLIFECLAWGATILMFYARYRRKSKVWFRIATIIGVLTGVIPQVTLGVINFADKQEIDLFTVIIIVLLVYGLTIGKKHIKRLDVWAQARFSAKSDSYEEDLR
jgi:hypothetical protein